MSADPNPASHPLLFAVVQQHVAYYKEAGEYPSKTHICGDLQKDSQFGAILVESAINADSPNALRAFRRTLWPIVRRYMASQTGWWARTYGRNASFFHEDWGTPEDFAAAVNLRIADREKDGAVFQRLYAMTQERCREAGDRSFDPEYDERGELARVNVHKYDAAPLVSRPL